MNICMVVYNFVNNGIGKVVLTYSSELVKNGHVVTVLVGGPTEKRKTEEAAELGISIVDLPNKKRRPLEYFKALRKALNVGLFDIVHIHGNSGMILPELIVANCSRAVAVICHCHSTGSKHPVLHQVLKPLVPHFCNCRFACSAEAGEWLYGKSSFTILPNSFDIGAFAFDNASRKAIRRSYGIGDHTVVLGNVARLNPEKNHAFLIRVFEQFRKRNPDSLLMIVGGGPGEKEVRRLVESSPNKDFIIMLGNIDNPSKLYSAMDCFVFPSIHEGFGIVLVEAQISGLRCFVSDVVPRGACVSDRFYAIPLSSGADGWVDRIVAALGRPESRDADLIVDSRFERFDIHASYRLLEGAYEKALLRGVGK